MRIGRVIGQVILSRQIASFKAGSYLLVDALDQAALVGLGHQAPRTKPMAESLVVFDELGAGLGQLIAVSESKQARQPFLPQGVAVDAYNAAILDDIQVTHATLKESR